MFSINIYLRFAIIALSLVLGLWLNIAFGFWYGFVFYLSFIFFLAGYFILGTVQSAALLVQEMDFEGATKRLNLTFFPKLLYSANRAYYYMLKGTIALNAKDNDAAEAWMTKAQDTGLNSDNERAMVLLQLANLNASRNKWQQATIQMKQLKELKVTEPAIKEQVKQFEKALNNRGLLKPGNRGMMIQPGGKRKRPKPR
jgi:ABC-type xylose transport system permease subunit